MTFDVAIIGGGAAGLCAAVYIKQKQPSLSVAVLEALDRVGKKLITTGNGRCNITNATASVSDYHGAEPEFIAGVFDRYFVDDAVRFFESIGVETVFEPDGKAYPASFQASSVVDALRLACDESGVVTRCGFAVSGIKKSDIFIIYSDSGRVSARTVIATGGLMSGGKKVGSDGSVLAIARMLGHKCVPLSPSIVQLKTDTSLTRQLKGIKVNADVRLYRGTRLLRKEYGEVLFTDYGLSGPPILQVSRNADSKTHITLDLLPDTELDTLTQKLQKRGSILKNRTAENYLTGFLNKRVGQVILKECGIKLTDSVADIDGFDVIAKKIKGLTFDVVGNTGFANSQVSAGGISHTELTRDLESKKTERLFFAGEIIDVDGDCGGYNLQWAWSSAFTAAEGALKCLS